MAKKEGQYELTHNELQAQLQRYLQYGREQIIGELLDLLGIKKLIEEAIAQHEHNYEHKPSDD